MPVVQDDLRLEVGSPDVDAARPPDPLGIRHTSPEEVMRSKLRLVHTLVCGTNEQLWKRLLRFEEVVTRKAALQLEMAAELEARRQGLPEQENSSGFLLVPKLTSWGRRGNP